MKVWIIKRHHLLTVFFCFLVIVGILVGVTGISAVTGAASRKLPVYSVETDEKKIAITFDAAWTNQDTEEIVDILKKHNAVATFFIVGDWAEKFPESVSAFFNAGHEIANHSDTHKSFSKCDYEQIKQEILSCNEKLTAITGKEVTLVRAPSGDYTDRSLDVTENLNMTMIQWNVDTPDTKINLCFGKVSRYDSQ